MPRYETPRSLQHAAAAAIQELEEWWGRASDWGTGEQNIPARLKSAKTPLHSRHLPISLIGLGGVARERAQRWLFGRNAPNLTERLNLTNNVVSLTTGKNHQHGSSFAEIQLKIAPSPSCLLDTAIDFLSFCNDGRLLVIADSFDDANRLEQADWIFPIANYFDVVWL